VRASNGYNKRWSFNTALHTKEKVISTVHRRQITFDGQHMHNAQKAAPQRTQHALRDSS